jgi:hypothetical protein
VLGEKLVVVTGDVVKVAVFGEGAIVGDGVDGGGDPEKAVGAGRAVLWAVDSGEASDGVEGGDEGWIQVWRKGSVDARAGILAPDVEVV